MDDKCTGGSMVHHNSCADGHGTCGCGYEIAITGGDKFTWPQQEKA
jgi:hypothetical protein